MSIKRILSLMSAAIVSASLSGFAQTPALTDNIVIDQFGYREQAKKVAVVRVPQLGTGSPSTYAPGGEFEVINEASGSSVFAGAPASFKGGQTDAASGDKIWHFDFSSVSTPGRYYVLDKANNVRSFPFNIANNVYRDVLKASIKMFYYQRAGTAKPAQYAGEWTDVLCFEQDKRTRSFFDKDNATTEKDLSGGWFDAGDYNKYTKWTADYISSMIQTYEENPSVFTDDYGIPESGNGVADIIDEAKWGLEWLFKMQNADGSMLSVQGLSGGSSPPSTVTGPSYYGPANTTASYGSARTFAIAARFFDANGGTAEYVEKLKNAALKAWGWAEANPDSLFHNNCKQGAEDWEGKIACPNYDSRGLAAGNQETADSWDKVENRISTALALYELTGENSYLKIFEDNWIHFPLKAWGAMMQQYRFAQHILLIRYLESSYGKPAIKTAIQNEFKTAFAKPTHDNANHFGEAFKDDGYRAYIYNYQWGSNKVKADQGLTYYYWNIVDPAKDYRDAAEDYLHYIHGVNPLNMVYLTSMESYGASKSASIIWHDWWPGTKKPAPGYMPGGPNENYYEYGCCPSGCDIWGNSQCGLVERPHGLPPAKMYKNFNDSWPHDSWEITEPSNGYQLGYIRLLSKFVGTGSSSIAQRGGAGAKNVVKSNFYKLRRGSIELKVREKADVRIFGLNGALVSKRSFAGGVHSVSLKRMPKGIYVVKLSVDGQDKILRVPNR